MNQRPPRRQSFDTATLWRSVAIGIGAVFAVVFLIATALGLSALRAALLAAALGFFVGGGLGLLVGGSLSADRQR